MDEAIIKRILPHSIDAEKAVIGSMIMDADAVVAASEMITGDFTSVSTAFFLMPWLNFTMRGNL